MKVHYKREFHHSYLILEEQNLPDCESYGIRMLLNSNIPGLLNCTIHKIDNQALFYYEITSKQSLASMYEGQKINREMLVLLIGALIRTFEEMESYLLDPMKILLIPEYIFMNVIDREVGFVYWPEAKMETGSFLSLMEYLLPRINHQDQDAVVLGYQLYRRAMDDQINLQEIRRELYQETLQPEKEEVIEESCERKEQVLEAVLHEVRKEEAKETRLKPGITMGICLFLVVLYLYLMRNQYFSWPVFALILGVCVLIGVVTAAIWWIRKKNQKFHDSNTIDTVPSFWEKVPDIMDESKTTLLIDKSQPFCKKLQAVHSQNSEDIVLGEGTILLGKKADVADVVLSSAAVSRVHAKIKVDEETTVFDLNSRNGTYVNYESITGNEGRVLKEGDIVAFADLVYRYTEEAADLHPLMESSIMREKLIGADR